MVVTLGAVPNVVELKNRGSFVMGLPLSDKLPFSSRIKLPAEPSEYPEMVQLVDVCIEEWKQDSVSQ